jgi:hypothetical protein
MKFVPVIMPLFVKALTTFLRVWHIKSIEDAEKNSLSEENYKKSICMYIIM